MTSPISFLFIKSDKRGDEKRENWCRLCSETRRLPVCSDWTSCTVTQNRLIGTGALPTETLDQSVDLRPDLWSRAPVSGLPLCRRILDTGPTGRKPPSRPRTHCKDYTSQLVWEHQGIHQEELQDVSRSQDKPGIPFLVSNPFLCDIRRVKLSGEVIRNPDLNEQDGSNSRIKGGLLFWRDTGMNGSSVQAQFGESNPERCELNV